MITTTPPNFTTSPGGILIPAGPAPQDPTTTTPSGLIVVERPFTPVTVGSQLVIADQPLSPSGALDAAKAAYAELKATHGVAAAGLAMGDRLELVQDIRNTELRGQAVQALRDGNFELATQLIAQQG